MVTKFNHYEHSITWNKLSELLSQVGYLRGDEDIDAIVLLSPKIVMFRTSRPIEVKDDQKA